MKNLWYGVSSSIVIDVTPQIYVPVFSISLEAVGQSN